MFAMRQPDPSPRTSRGSTLGPARDGDFVAVDTETTGLAWHDRLVELGAVRFRGDKVVAEWRTLVNPRRLIPASATAIHGITDAAVRDAPLAVEALTALERFCAGTTPWQRPFAPWSRSMRAPSWLDWWHSTATPAASARTASAASISASVARP